jgi:hypothetical protein
VGSGRLRLADFYDFQHYEGGKVVTLTHRPSLPPGVSWYSFLEAESTPGHMVRSVATEKILSDTIGNRSRDPPTSSGCLNHYAILGHAFIRHDPQYLFCFPQNCIYFLILRFSLQIILPFFIDHVFKFKYQPGHLRVKVFRNRIS